MKLPQNPKMKFGLLAALLGLALVAALFYWSSPTPVIAQNTAPPAKQNTATNAAAVASQSLPPATNAPAPAPAGAAAPTGTNAPAPVVSPSASESTATRTAEQNPPPGPANLAASAEAGPASPTDEIQLSFQGANIEMVVQWLAKTTGKSVVKHPRVQCQLTIVSSKKTTPREAINLVYRALSLEGFTAIESTKSILIVPEGQEPKMSPELLDGSRADVPEGRQRLIKVFPLKYVQPGELKDKVRPVLSEKGNIDIDERASQLIVTDYNDNLRLLGELIKELDVASTADTVIEIYTLRFSQAEDMASLLGLILNAQAGTPTSSSASSRRPSPSPSESSPMPGGPPSIPGGASPPPGGSAAGSGGQQVKLWPDRTANRLIVSAPKSKLPEVKKLIDILDTDKPEDVGVRVLPLKHVSAEDLVKEIGPLYLKMSGKSLKDIVEVTASSRANSLIVLSSEINFKAIAKLVATLDTEDAQEKRMEVFPLKNADAEDVAKQLKDLGQDQEQSRYPYYFFSSSSSSSKASKKPTVVSDRRRNTVIVQAPPGQMESIGKMIRELDAPVTDNSLAPKIYPLKYVSAVDIEDVLNELFLKKTQAQRPYWYYDEYPQETADKNVGRLYGKVRITSEPYSNSLIVTANSQEHLAAVEEVLKQLDVPSQAGETTIRMALKFAQSVTVASSVNILFAKGGSPPLRNVPQPGQPGAPGGPQQQNNSTQNNFELEKEAKEEAYYPWLGGQQENTRSTDGRSTARPVSDLVGRVRVVPDRRSNSLMVTANVHLLPQVLKLINELDAPTAQVLIEAKIIEVSTDFRDKLGVRWSPDGKQAFTGEDLDNSLMVKGSSAYQNTFLGSKMASSLRSGVLDASLNLDFLIQFLRKNTDSKVLAEPQINIADNELGKLFVGARVPFLLNSVINNTGLGGRNDAYDYKDVGIILEVTPHINNSEEVALKIRAESSSIRPGETLFGAAILDTRNFRTDLMVKSGQTIVLGGIIQREDVNTIRKVPLLGSIPGLGWAFKKKDKVTREVELMVFLRPVVTRTPQQARDLLEEVERKTPKIKQSNDAQPDRKE